MAQDKVRWYYHHNLYYRLHLVVLGNEQEAVRAGDEADQFPQRHVKCQKSNILDWRAQMVRNICDLQATLVSTRRCKSEASWQLEAACTGLRQH